MSRGIARPGTCIPPVLPPSSQGRHHEPRGRPTLAVCRTDVTRTSPEVGKAEPFACNEERHRIIQFAPAENSSTHGAMSRLGRLRAPGTLPHSMIRGLEHRNTFNAESARHNHPALGAIPGGVGPLWSFPDSAIAPVFTRPCMMTPHRLTWLPVSYPVGHAAASLLT